MFSWAGCLTRMTDAKKWKCPDCHTGESEDEHMDEDAIEEDVRPTSQQSDVPRMARDLLAVPIGSDDGDSHSVFNELVLQEDPGDGSRLLRKRKTSSISNEPDAGEMHQTQQITTTKMTKTKMTTKKPWTVLMQSERQLVLRAQLASRLRSRFS
jgi:histone acetyltransferase SAS3